jgi:hypothetical protein
MNRNRRSGIIIGVSIAALFLMPLLVLAAIYLSGSRENVFQPGSAAIQIKEGSSKGDRLENSYLWTEGGGDVYYAEKPAAVHDVRNRNDEYLRVRFVPMWLDESGCVIGGQPEFSDYSSILLNAAGTALLFQDNEGPANTLLTLELAENWQQDWILHTESGKPEETCFYYKGLLRADKTTPDLITRVVIPQSVYDSTDTMTFRLDVLADAVQQYGGATSERDWAENPAVTTAAEP